MTISWHRNCQRAQAHVASYLLETFTNITISYIVKRCNLPSRMECVLQQSLQKTSSITKKEEQQSPLRVGSLSSRLSAAVKDAKRDMVRSFTAMPQSAQLFLLTYRCKMQPNSRGKAFSALHSNGEIATSQTSLQSSDNSTDEGSALQCHAIFGGCPPQ